MAQIRESGGNWNVVCLLLLTSLVGLSTAVFEGCDHTWSINAGYTYLESPYYPQYYPASSSCRYKFIAPLDYEIRINCTIDLAKSGNQCSTEKFYIARDGDSQLRESEELCGNGIAIRNSIFNSVVMAYISGGSWGRFQCSLYVSKQPCDCGWSVNTKIVNGQVTGVNEFPFMVALLDKTASSYRRPAYCGGAIVSHNAIITAAHCARVQNNPANIIASVGEHDLFSTTESKYTAQYAISQIIVHPNYVSDPVRNDIAIFKTTTAIQWSRGVGPICLPPNNNNNFAYAAVTVLGWGSNSTGGPTSDKLQKVNLQILANSDCQAQYQGVGTITSSNICTYDSTGRSKDACQFDSGGPVCYRSSMRQFLVGIISWGKPCGSGGYATGINERIGFHLAWIQQNVGTTCPVAL